MSDQQGAILQDDEILIRQLNDAENSVVTCICPKCGIYHKLKFMWTGRGMPRKFCPLCKSYVAADGAVDLCGISSSIRKGLTTRFA